MEAIAALGVTHKGLQNFIADIRGVANKEKEQERVDEEMANIRAKFANSASLSSYQKKKYVWKLVYIFMLGYEVDFGHMEVINLITAASFGEKNCGYVATQVLLKNTDEMMTLVVNSIRNDLISPYDWSQTLALACIANMGGVQMAETLGNDVQRVLVAQDTKPVVRKKAALCMLRLFRVAPDAVQASEWAPRVVSLLEDRHLGVLLCVMNLLLELVKHDPTGYVELRPHCILLLSRLVMHRACTVDYLYYSTPSPWLQVKLLQVLQYFPPPSDATQVGRLNEILRKVVTKTDVGKSVNKNNADHSVLFEAVNLIISQGTASDARLRNHAIVLLGKYLSVMEPNIRYLGLETMSRLVHLDAETAEIVKKHQSTVIFSLKDADISVRRRALDLLFVMCDTSNALDIVEELINYLIVADIQIREELVLKIAILAETFATDFRWYVDTVLKLVTIAGDYVADDVWHRTIQIITNDEDLQKYAAETLFRAMEPTHVHDTALNISGYVLGEFGFLIADQEGMGGEAQFNTLHQHFSVASDNTRALLLTAYAKMVNLYDDIRPLVQPVFEKHRAVVSNELQQRAIEYAALPLDESVMQVVLEAMPAFPQDRESSLMIRLRDGSEQTQDRAKWAEARRSIAGDDDEDNDSDGGGGRRAPAEGSAEPEFAPMGAPAPAAGSGSGDLLNLADDDVAVPPPQSNTASMFDPVGHGGGGGGGGGGADLLGMGAASAPAPAGGPALPLTLPETLNPKLVAWYTDVVRAGRGVLLEIDGLQLGCQTSFDLSVPGSRAVGTVTLFLGNKGQSGLSGVALQLPQNDSLRLETNAGANSVMPGAQVQLVVRAACFKPYAESPAFRLSFSSPAGQHEYTLRLPTPPTSFFVPVAIPGPAFVPKWQALAAPEQQQQEAFTSPRVDAARTKEIVTGILHMAIAQGVDTSDATVTAAGMFRTCSVGGNGEPINVGVLLRVELNPAANAYRVTVRAVNGTVALGLKSVLKTLLV